MGQSWGIRPILENSILWQPPEQALGPETLMRPLSRHSCFSPLDLPALALCEDGTDNHYNKIISSYVAISFVYPKALLVTFCLFVLLVHAT